VAAGARRAGREPGACALSVPAFVATGRSAEERARAREELRARIAFYASTPSYQIVMEHHGWAQTRRDLGTLAARRQWGEMSALITDEMLRHFVVDAEPGDVAAALREKYDGVADRISLSHRFAPGQDDHFWRQTIAALRSE